METEPAPAGTVWDVMLGQCVFHQFIVWRPYGGTMLSGLKQFFNWLTRVARWIADTRSPVFALSPLLVSILLCLAVPTWGLRFRLLAMVSQLFGVVIVAIGLRQTSELFKEPHFFRVWRMWLDSRPSFHRDIRLVVGSGQLKIEGGAVSALATVSTSPSMPVEERLNAIEKNLNQLNLSVHEIKKTLDAEVRNQRAALDSERRDREMGDEKIEKRLRSATAGGIHLEWVGLFWLTAGIVLSYPDVVLLVFAN